MHIVTAINVLYHYNVEERSRARQLLGRALREGSELVEGDGFVFAATPRKDGRPFVPSAVHLYADLDHMDFVVKFGMAVPDIDVSGLEREFSYAMQNIKISGLDAVAAADFLTKAFRKAGFTARNEIPGIVTIASSPVMTDDIKKLSEEFEKIFYRERGIFENTLEGPAVNFLVVGDNQRDLPGGVKKLDVAAALAGLYISGTQKGADGFIAGDERRFHMARLRILWEGGWADVLWGWF